MKFNPYLIHIEDEDHLYRELKRVGSTETGNRLMMTKGRSFAVRIDNVSLKAANILKQEMLARGGDAAVHRDVAGLTAGDSSMLLIGTKRQFAGLLDKLKLQPFGLKTLGQELAEVIDRHEKLRRPPLSYRGRTLNVGEKTLVMGILNLTPDSFSDGGRWADLDRAVAHAKEMVANGADLIDVGGESTRPGHAPVSAEEEMQRVVPVIEVLSKEIDVPISIDTYKASVARAAIEAGAHIVNDVWGFKADPAMAATCAELDCPVMLMHNRETPYEDDVITGVVRDLRECIDLALEAGVRDERIWLDPGIGFGKTHEQNLYVMRRLEDICGLGYPVLLGTSRKSMIGNALNLPVEERVEGTAATVALGITKGVEMIRVHDVKEMSRVARMTDAMIRS